MGSAENREDAGNAGNAGNAGDAGDAGRPARKKKRKRKTQPADRCWGRSFPILPCPWERRLVWPGPWQLAPSRARANDKTALVPCRTHVSYHNRAAQTNSVSTLAVTVISLIPQGCQGEEERAKRTLARWQETSPLVAGAGLVSRKVGRGSRIGASREGATQTRQNTLLPASCTSVAGPLVMKLNSRESEKFGGFAGARGA